MSDITITIDGNDYTGKKGQSILEVARENGVYIPTLCDYKGLKPSGTCRICTVKVNGRNMAACTTPAENGQMIDNKTEVLENHRKALVEMLFAEGNHMCPTCEKSGNCELQALGYRYKMLVPRFPYLFPKREVDGKYGKIMIDTNRCVQCLRCVRGVRTSDGKNIFGFIRRGDRTIISADVELANKMSDKEAQKAMDLCPVGTILKKEVGFNVPIGERKFDKMLIGSDIEG